MKASVACAAVLKKVDAFKTVYPNKVFDYMSACKSTIVAIDGVARKLIEDAKAGLYVEPEDAEAFVEAVLKLKVNRELCEIYGNNGLDFVRKNFDRSLLADKYMGILTGKAVSGKKQRAVK